MPGLCLHDAILVFILLIGQLFVLPLGPPEGGRLGTTTDVQQMWQRLAQGADCIRLPPQGRPVAAPRDHSPAFQTLGFSEAGLMLGGRGPNGSTEEREEMQGQQGAPLVFPATPVPGYLDAESITCFDPPAFGMSQSEAEILDPQQRLCAKAAWEAMEDASVAKARGAPSLGKVVGGKGKGSEGEGREGGDRQRWGPLASGLVSTLVSPQ